MFIFMNALDQAIIHALQAEGATSTANKAYLEFIKANFIIPIHSDPTHEEPHVLYLEENNQYFLPVFTEKEYLSAWANSIEDRIELLMLSGVDLLKGIGENVCVSLNIGAPSYKEFNPAELARMRSMVLKLFQ